MSQHTRVLLLRPHPVADVHAWVNAELLHAPDARRDPAPTTGHGEHTVGNPRGQGLDAILWLSYRPDGPIAARRYVGDDPVTTHEVWEDIAHGSVLLHFDTSYGWRDGDANCADLHAWYVLRLARQYGPLWWNDEGNGLWHLLEDGDDPQPHDLKAFARFGGDPNRYRPGTIAA